MRTLLLLSEQEAARSNEAIDPRPKNFLNETEVEKFLAAARKGFYGERDYCMALLCFRHGLRVKELVTFRLDDVDLDGGRVFVRRQKGSMSTSQPMDGDEIRAVRAWLRKRKSFAHRDSVFLFLSERGPMVRHAFTYICKEIGKRMEPPCHVHPHMLRHSCGYALANRGKDTRLIQDWLGHRDIKNTERYTRTSAKRFETIWH